METVKRIRHDVKYYLHLGFSADECGYNLDGRPRAAPRGSIDVGPQGRAE
jgi:hypothetical protein